MIQQPAVNPDFRKRWGRVLPPLAVGLVALSVRAFFLLGIEAYPKFELIRNKLDDQMFFHAWAVAMVQERPLDLAATGHEFAYWAQGRPGVYPQDPLYAWMLATVYRAFGFEYDLVRWLQALLGGLAAGLTCLLAMRLVRWPAAMASGLAVGLYGPLVFYEAAFLREALAAALCVGVLCLLDTALRRDEAPHPAALVLLGAGGLLLGAGVLLRSNLLVFAVGAAVWVGWASRSRRATLVFALALALPIAPVVFLNTSRSGRLALVSSSGPYNFFVGNVQDATGDGKGSWAYYEAVKASGPPDTVGLYRKAIENIAADPLAYLKLQAHKTRLFFTPADMPDNLSVPMGRKTNPRLALAPVELNVLLVPALAGLLLGLRRWRRLSLFYVFFALYAASIIAFFVVSRLQLPMVPVLAVFAAIGVDAWLGALRRRAWKTAAVTAAIAVGVAVWLRPPRDAYRGVDLDMAASACLSRGMIEEEAGHARLARHLYGRAVALNPDHGGALARFAAVAGDPPAAPRPESLAMAEEARTAAAAKRYDKARDLLAEVSRLEPDWALPHQFLANVAFLEGKRREALEHLELAVELSPLDPAMRANLKNLRTGS